MREEAARALPPARPSPALLGEIIGLPIRITQAPGLLPLPFDGVIADETMHLLLVRPRGRRRPRRIAKAGLVATVVKDGDELPLRGDGLRVRPEDRTKLLALGGRRRPR